MKLNGEKHLHTQIRAKILICENSATDLLQLSVFALTGRFLNRSEYADALLHYL